MSMDTYLGDHTRYRLLLSNKDCHSISKRLLAYRSRLRMSASEWGENKCYFHTYLEIGPQWATRVELESPASHISQSDKDDHRPP